MKTILKIFLTASILIGSLQFVNAQCKTFTKKECQPLLSPYIYNGQLNSAVLNEGDFAELMLTFYSNQEYRIVVCSAEELGSVVFKLLDMTGNVIFSNEEHNMIDHWDFATNSTQQLRVEVSVPESTKKGELYKSGCVSILIGFMDSQD